MPPNCIEISDEEGSPQAVPPRTIRALARKFHYCHSHGILLTDTVVADVNTRIEETGSAIKTYKDDVAHLKKLLRSAEERLEKEQDKRHTLVENKNEALDSGVTEINTRSGLGNGEAKVGVKHEVKHEPRVKMEELSQEGTGQGIRQQSIFLGVQVPRRAPSTSSNAMGLESSITSVTRERIELASVRRERTAPPHLPLPKTARINRGLGDSDSGDVPMVGYDSTDDNESYYRSSGEQQPETGEKLVSPVPQSKPLRTIPTRGKRWRGGRNAGRAIRFRGPSGSIATVPQNSKSFRREIISSAIGGQLRYAWPTPDQNGDFAIKVVRYCCIRRKNNWCLPSHPGDSENSLMFSSRPTGWDGADFPLFITEQGTDWKYYGDYRITECCTVSLQKWRGFGEAQKIDWCKHMLTKKVILGKRFREGELGRDGWKKVYDLFEKVNNPYCALFLTCLTDRKT